MGLKSGWVRFGIGVRVRNCIWVRVRVRGGVRNMGNFNFSLTHVLTIFHHVEQCCYPSFLTPSHIPAMTSHVAYVIHALFTLITTQGLCNITFLSYDFLSFMHLGPYLSYVLYLFPSLKSMSPYSLCIGSGIKSI